MSERIVSKQKAHSPKDRLTQLMDEVAELEANLNLLRSDLSSKVSEFQSAMQPYILRMASQRRLFLKGLAEALHRPRLTHRRKLQISDLAYWIAKSFKDSYRISLTEDLEALGFQSPSELPDFEEDDDSHDHPSHTYIPEPHAAHATASKPEHQSSKAAHKMDPDALRKSLYMGLVRELHPDKTTDLTEREQRTQLMQQLNVANQEHDLRTMVLLLQEYGSAHAQTLMNSQSLRALQQTLSTQATQLRSDIQLILDDLPKVPGGWLKMLRDPSAWTRFVKSEITNAQKNEKHYAQLWRQLMQPGELENFLHNTDERDWIEIF